MTKAHKDALARGRDEGRAVRRYLEAIERNRPRRGRKRSPESVRKRLSDVDERLESADPLARLHLLQERADLQAELARASSSNDLGSLEKAFVKVAKAYGQRKGIEYNAWRAAGVSAAVLQRADITRTSSDGTSPGPSRSAGASKYAGTAKKK
ncbi:MAG TPA: hypothetical protein VK215_04735 [Acidimicrobiales bacterium]|nr:hypothetical protein [Acidimicrobiales bacterium]